MDLDADAGLIFSSPPPSCSLTILGISRTETSYHIEDGEDELSTGETVVKSDEGGIRSNSLP